MTTHLPIEPGDVEPDEASGVSELEPAVEDAEEAGEEIGEQAAEDDAEEAAEEAGEEAAEEAGADAAEEAGEEEPAAIYPVEPARRPRSWLVLGTSMLLAALIPTLALLGGVTLIDSREGRTIFLEGASAVTVLPSTPTALVVHITPEGTVADLTMLAIGPSGNGGTVVLIPVATEAELPSGRVDRLDTAYVEGGLDELREAVEGVLNVRFDVVAVLDDAAWGSLTDPVGPLTVTLLDPVLEQAAPDQVVERFPAGPNTLTPAEVGSFLAAPGVGESEIARLVRVQSFWEVWLDALADDAETTDGTAVTTSVPPRDASQSLDLGTFLDGLAAGPVRFEVLPVRVPEGPAIDGVERYEPDVPRIRLLAAEVAPSAVTSTSGGTRVRIVDPVGDPELLQAVVANLVFLGANVVIASGSNDDPQPTSEVVYYGTETAAVAESLAEYLHTDRVVASEDLLEGLDLTVVLGENLADLFLVPEPPTTTTAVPIDTVDPAEPQGADAG